MVSSGDQKEGVATIIKHNYSTPIFLCCNETYNIDDMPENTFEEKINLDLEQTYEI